MRIIPHVAHDVRIKDFIKVNCSFVIEVKGGRKEGRIFDKLKIRRKEGLIMGMRDLIQAVSKEMAAHGMKCFLKKGKQCLLFNSNKLVMAKEVFGGGEAVRIEEV